MDDIQFWLYLVFGLIYFVGRFLKKKKAPVEVENEESVPQSRPQKAKTFEELLREFTDESIVEEAPKQAPVMVEEYTPKSKQIIEQKTYEEGVTRRFSDEESKKIYEDSVKRAEGFELDFAPDEHFKSKIKPRQDEIVTSSFASEIREGLKDPEQVKKAIIYAEIFNRKY